MRVLTVGNMYPPHNLGGYELTWRSSVEHLRGAGHDVRVLTTDLRLDEPDSTFSEGRDVHRELRWYWRDHDFPRRSAGERLAIERHNARVLRSHLDDMRPDAIAWWAMGGMSLSLLGRARARGLPAVGVVGDDWMVYGPKVDAWLRMARWAPPVARLAAGAPARMDLSAARWLFNSETTRHRGIEHGCPPGLADVAHPGIEDGLFRTAPAHEWSWRLLCVGRIDERKGLDTAIEALVLLPAEATLTVLGRGDEEHLRELRGLVAERGLDGRVSFGACPRTELPAAYADADALLFPVRWEEPWGLVPLEAMAVGLPVVATGTGGSGEYLRDGENALVIGRDAGAEDLAGAVRRLADGPELRARLREGGLRTAPRYTERGYNEAIAAALERAVTS